MSFWLSRKVAAVSQARRIPPNVALLNRAACRRVNAPIEGIPASNATSGCDVVLQQLSAQVRTVLADLERVKTAPQERLQSALPKPLGRNSVGAVFQSSAPRLSTVRLALKRLTHAHTRAKSLSGTYSRRHVSRAPTPRRAPASRAIALLGHAVDSVVVKSEPCWITSTGTRSGRGARRAACARCEHGRAPRGSSATDAARIRRR
jgi:hypothetical protein